MGDEKSREQVTYELTVFIAGCEEEPYDARDFTLRLYQECDSATGGAQSLHGIAFDLMKIIAISGKDPRRAGKRMDRKYVLELYGECLKTVHMRRSQGT